jgi:hypothetical protein
VREIGTSATGWTKLTAVMRFHIEMLRRYCAHFTRGSPMDDSLRDRTRSHIPCGLTVTLFIVILTTFNDHGPPWTRFLER